MIEINVIVPSDDAHYIASLEGNDFQVFNWTYMTGNRAYYHVSATEEHFTLLSLKYSGENVWKR